MTKPSLLRARTAFEDFCQENGIASERVDTKHGLLAYFVPASFNEQAEDIKRFLTDSGREAALQFKTVSLPTGRLYVLAINTLSESGMTDLAEDAATYFNEFHTRLSEVLEPSIDEMNLRQPTSALRRANAGNQFPSSLQNYQRPNSKKKKPSRKNMDAKIEEALEGIGTPDDVQPQQGLKSLFSALKQSGLAQELKKQGVSWHVAEPGKHAITFTKGDVPILQLTSIELGDVKVLGDALSQLTSIAQGQPPQAAQLELDRVKEMAARASERKGALDDIAQQFALPKPEEQQPVTIARP